MGGELGVLENGPRPRKEGGLSHLYVELFQKSSFHFRFLHNKPSIALLTTELRLLTCFFPK